MAFWPNSSSLMKPFFISTQENLKTDCFDGLISHSK
jgi:hypothetical protein